MRRTAEQQQLKRWWKNIIRGDVGFGMFMATGVIAIACMFFALSISKNSTDGDRRADLATLLHSNGADAKNNTEKMVSLRKTDAKAFLRVYEHNKALTNNDLSDEELAVVRAAAATGEAAEIDLSKMSWDWMYLPLAIWLEVMLSVIMIFHCIRSSDNSLFVADMNWRMPWVWLFVLLTLLPAGFIVWPASLIRFLLWRHGIDQADQNRVVRLQAQRQANVAPAQPGANTPHTHAPAQTRNYYSSPGAAREVYRALRGGLWNDQQKRALQAAQNDLQDAERYLRETSAMLKAQQTEVSGAKARVQQLEEDLVDTAPQVTQALIDEEFDCMITLDGVTAIKVVNNDLVFIVEGTLPYQGKLYDVGDWELRIGADGFSCTELRTGVLASWEGGYPAYRLYDGSFCFGNRRGLIDQHIAKGQFLEAIQVAVSSIQNVNPEDAKKVPRTFKEVKA